MNPAQFAGIFWLVVCVVLFIVEGMSVQLISIWFSVGALFAMIAALMGGNFTVQLAVFLISSIAVLLIGRPILKGRLNLKKSATNADLVIGKVGVVLEEIDNIMQTGRVSANGLDWTARSVDDGVIIPKGEQVKAVSIDGVKLIVKPLKSSLEN